MRREAWRIAILYVALTMVLAYPLTVNPADACCGRLDTDLFIGHCFRIRTSPIGCCRSDANIYYPQPLTLAYSENFIGSVFAAPIMWLTGNVVLAMNVVTLLSAVFARRATCSRAAWE
jgi:hypothetical protein